MNKAMERLHHAQNHQGKTDHELKRTFDAIGATSDDLNHAKDENVRLMDEARHLQAQLNQ
jgi:hypothetical protein